MIYSIDTVNYNKAAIYAPGHGYSLRPAAMSEYRSIIDHTTNGRIGTTLRQEALYIFNSPDISAHFLLGKYGEIIQFLDPKKYIAWHAGCVKAMKYSNPYAIGIEMHNTPAEGHCTPAQLGALDWLVRRLIAEHTIDPIYVETHRAVAVYCAGHPLAGQLGRKIDPSGFPDSEFYAWRSTLGLTTYKVINPRGVNIRQAPNINAIIAGTLAYNQTFVSDGLNADENGQVINGSSIWAHMQSGLGFVHTSNLVKI